MRAAPAPASGWAPAGAEAVAGGVSEAVAGDAAEAVAGVNPGNLALEHRPYSRGGSRGSSRSGP